MKLQSIAAGFMIIAGIALIGTNTAFFLQGYLAVEKEKSFSPSPPLTETVKQKGSFTEDRVLYTNKPRVGEDLGELYIPRLEQIFPLYEGTSKEVLRKGVGHYKRSALPGENNHTILSGHRDTVFRGLRYLNLGDELVITTKTGQFIYKVHQIRIVDAEDKTVITPKPTATLTLTTCYPFYFIGNAPKRYIISAKLLKTNNVITWNSSE